MTRLSRAIRKLIKSVLPYRQFLALYHRVCNRGTLTVVTFHRVLSQNDPRWPGALREWTICETVFEQCLVFFRQHYNLVGLGDLFACLRGKQRLPPRSLLVTFDDGYADNEEYALPLLLRHRVPAVLFLTSAFVNRRSRPWTEDLQSAYERGHVSHEEVNEIHRSLFPTDSGSKRDTSVLLRDIRAHWTGLADAEVEELCTEVLQHPLERLTSPVQMLTSDQVKRMHAAGTAIAAHGRTHNSMPRITDLDTELQEPRREISSLLGLPTLDAIEALAFPYGEYSEQVLRRAVDVGYKLLFTFSQRLNPLSHGRLVSSVLDRVNVSGPMLAPDGEVSSERLARYFFFLPRCRTIVLDKSLGHSGNDPAC